jgi:hypothetical protein
MASLKEWLENHPAIAVLGVAVSVGSVCSAVTAYLLERVNKAEKIEATNKYNTQISDLTTRLSSIERRAGPNQEKRYFDVQSMQVSLAEVRNLPAQFKNFDNGAFFLNAPISQTWNYAVLSEGEVAKLGLWKTLVEAIYTDERMKSLAQVFKGHAWYSNSLANARFNIGSDSVEGSLVSHLHIIKVTRGDFATKAAAAAGMASDLRRTPPRAESKKIGSAIEEIQRLKEQDSPEARVEANADPEPEVKKMFEQLFDGDTAGMIFVDALIRKYSLAFISPNISFSILSAQKQLNVMYIDVNTSISDATIEKSFDETCKEGKGTTIIVRHELFFVSYGEGGYIIDAQVPTCDGRSKAFDWITQWLAGLRIAVKAVS